MLIILVLNRLSGVDILLMFESFKHNAGHHSAVAGHLHFLYLRCDRFIQLLASC